MPRNTVNSRQTAKTATNDQGLSGSRKDLPHGLLRDLKGDLSVFKAL